jgi:integration host factor subunit beta
LKVVKSELVQVLKEKLPELQQRDVELAVNCMLTQMADAIAKGERIEVRGFGGFDLHHRAPRTARNPRTGESVDLPAKVKVHFKPGKEMRDRVDAAHDQCDITDKC